MTVPDGIESASEPSGGSKLIATSKWFGRVCAPLSASLILAMAAVLVLKSTLWHHGGGVHSEDIAAVVIMVFLWIGWIPVGLLCLVGASLSFVAWTKYSSRQGWTAFWLSIFGPVVIAIFFGVSWVIAGEFPWRILLADF